MTVNAGLKPVDRRQPHPIANKAVGGGAAIGAMVPIIITKVWPDITFTPEETIILATGIAAIFGALRAWRQA